MPPEEPASNDIARTFQRTLVVVGVLAGVAIVWVAHEIFLLIFAGLLLGVLLDGLSVIVSRLTHLTRGWSLVATILVLTGISVTMGNLMAAGILSQMKQLQVALPKSLEQIRQYLAQFGWGQSVLAESGNLRNLANGGAPSDLVARVTDALSITIGVIARMVLVIVLGIYSAAEPAMYRLGFLRLFTRHDSERIAEILQAVQLRMWWWLLSVFGSMISLTVLAFIGLKILGIPLALTLALLTGLITFIPNFGAVLSAIPPVLIGLMESPEKALAVIVLYIIIQFLEADLITPLIQRQTIRMPPVVGISAQLTLGMLFGFLGLLLAAPIMAGILAILNTIAGERMIHEEHSKPTA